MGVGYGIVWGGWGITFDDWRFIEAILRENKIKTVLEFGAGLSSLLISELAEVVSYETISEHAVFVQSKMIENRLTIRNWNGKDIEGDIGKFDLAFVDGPFGGSKYGREHSIRIASEHSDKIIIHDGKREGEMHWQDVYLKDKFELKDTNGQQQNCCHYWTRLELDRIKNSSMSEIGAGNITWEQEMKRGR